MNELVNGAVTVAIAIVGVALLAVLVSKNANTVGVIGASAQGFSNSLLAAEAPVLSGGAFGGIGSLGNNQYGPGYV